MIINVDQEAAVALRQIIDKGMRGGAFNGSDVVGIAVVQQCIKVMPPEPPADPDGDKDKK